MMNLTTLAATLRVNGIPVLDVTPVDDQCDAEIKVSDVVQVQVGWDYAIVSRTEFDDQGEVDGWRHWRTCNRIEPLIEDIRTALKG